MKLTRTERWILSNQLRIMEQLFPKEREDIETHRTALERGYEYLFGEACEHIYKDEDCLPAAGGKEVVEALVLYRALQSSAKRAPQGSVDSDAVAFPGFDGNNEGAYMGFCRTYCGGPHARFADVELENKDFNSHAPMRDSYRRMHRTWTELGGGHALSADQIKSILKARGY